MGPGHAELHVDAGRGECTAEGNPKGRVLPNVESLATRWPRYADGGYDRGYRARRPKPSSPEDCSPDRPDMRSGRGGPSRSPWVAISGGINTKRLQPSLPIRSREQWKTCRKHSCDRSFHRTGKPNFFFKLANLLFRFFWCDAEPGLQNRGQEFSVAITFFDFFY